MSTMLTASKRFRIGKPRPSRRKKLIPEETKALLTRALEGAITSIAGKNVPDNTKQIALRDCEKALEEVRAR